MRILTKALLVQVERDRRMISLPAGTPVMAGTPAREDDAARLVAWIKDDQGERLRLEVRGPVKRVQAAIELARDISS